MDREQQEVLDILQHRGAILDGHFVYASGLHGDKYINKDAVHPHVQDISFLCRKLAFWFRNADIEAVVGPEKGAIILAQWVAHHLGELTGRRVLAVYAERKERALCDGPATITSRPKAGTTHDYHVEGPGKIVVRPSGFIIKRGYETLINGARTLVVEDILTTGGSAKAVVQAVMDAGAKPLAVGALVNRGGVSAEKLETETLHSLLTLELRTWPSSQCPLCRDGIPINTDVGKGLQFLGQR